MSDTVLITGVAGNVGSRLAKHILSSFPDIVVVGVDNFLTGNAENIRSASLHNNFVFVEADCNDYEAMFSVFRERGIDYVFHYAACAGVERTLANPSLVFRDLEGIRNISKLSLEFGVKKIAYSSSSEVYGNPSALPLEVGVSPINPTLPYAMVKATAECYFRAFHSDLKTPYLIFRFFNTYGPEQSEDYVIKRFLMRAMKGADLHIFGDGSQVRTFLHSDDNVVATTKAMFSGLENVTLNVGSSTLCSIKELAELIIRVTDSSSNILYLPCRKEGDVMLRQPENSLFLRLLNRDETTLERGLVLTVRELNG
jgi:UDP-glucose 4-epimerase